MGALTPTGYPQAPKLKSAISPGGPCTSYRNVPYVNQTQRLSALDHGTALFIVIASFCIITKMAVTVGAEEGASMYYRIAERFEGLWVPY